MKTQPQVHEEDQELPAPADPPAPEVAPEVPTQSKLERRVQEAEKLGEVGRSLGWLQTQKLAQMAAETGPSMSGREEPVRRKL